MKSIFIFLNKLKFWKKKQIPPNPFLNPFLISVTNLTDDTQPFELFGASRNLTSVVNGVLETDDILIKDGISGSNYYDILFESITNPFSVGITYVLIEEGDTDNFDNDIKIITRRGNGNSYERRIQLNYDPLQIQKNIICVKEKYDIDAFTRLCGYIRPNSKLKFYFYPLNKNQKENNAFNFIF